jgi:hypothetical protein
MAVKRLTASNTVLAAAFATQIIEAFRVSHPLYDAVAGTTGLNRVRHQHAIFALMALCHLIFFAVSLLSALNLQTIKVL